MRYSSLLLLTVALGTACFAQEDDLAPVTIDSYNWKADKQAIPQQKNVKVNPAKAMTKDDLPFERRMREVQVQGSMPHPSEETPDGRREKLDRIEEEAATPKKSDLLDGYLYRATLRNNTKQTAAVVFWEFVFVELAKPSNVVRRQFLCAADIKPGATRELSAFSVLAPSDVVSSESLARGNAKLFKEEVYVNRVEFDDDTVIERKAWRFADVKKAVERVTASPWTKGQVCRGL
jgi:hypothetical protein